MIENWGVFTAILRAYSIMKNSWIVRKRLVDAEILPNINKLFTRLVCVNGDLDAGPEAETSVMKSEEEWAKRCEPSSPTAVVAKDAVETRLKAVWRFAKLAANDADRDVEYVHQLRVCVRRSGAALGLYSPLLPPSKARKLRKELKALRRAAGPARDLDVLAQRLICIEPRLPADSFTYLTELVQDKRRKAQRKLKRGYRRAKKDHFKKLASQLVNKIHWRGDGEEPVYGEFARDTLQPILECFFSAATEDLSDVRNLHQMRIKAKSVRYGMELLAPAFGKPLRKGIYTVFTQVQNRLGTINDHASAISFYSELQEVTEQEKCVEFIESMIEVERAELAASYSQFMEWWTPERIAGMKSQFETVLGQPSENRQQRVDVPPFSNAGVAIDGSLDM